jgi:type IV secretory pathway TrbF-like protein
MPAADHFSPAKQLYAEQYGTAIVTNTYLKLAVFLLAGGVAVQEWRMGRIVARLAEQKPLVLRIDSLGRTEALRYDAAAWTPQEPELRYFLGAFTRLYYGRNRYTIRQDFKKALLFLEEGEAQATAKAWAKQNVIESYLQEAAPQGAAADIDIDVRRVAIEDLRGPVYRAQVDYDQVFYDQERREKQRTSWIAQATFMLTNPVPHELLSVNPLGLRITHFREAAAFR